MPWCDACSKFWNPPEMAKGGTCPSCGRALGGAVEGGVTGSRAAEQGEPPEVPASGDGPATLARAKGAPWHFKLLLVGVTVYMVYRVYWLIEWLPKHL